MLGRGVFWEAYFRTLLLSAAAAVVTSALAFPCAYGIAFKLSETARRWAVFLMVILAIVSAIQMLLLRNTDHH